MICYIKRPLLIADELGTWALKSGLKELYPLQDLHVPIAYSRTGFAYFPHKSILVVEAGPRSVEASGDGAVMLRFESAVLTRRFDELGRSVATWDYPIYYPYITLTRYTQSVEGITPYIGCLFFGGEELALLEDV